jgi:hypothetical protein
MQRPVRCRLYLVLQSPCGADNDERGAQQQRLDRTAGREPEAQRGGNA